MFEPTPEQRAALADIGRAACVFGSARLANDHQLYAAARRVGAQLAEAGFAVITGGGAGIMEAANRGCREANGLSIGCKIELPHEQRLNDYVDLVVHFRHFFARKKVFVEHAEGFIFFPGGFGTLDELFEALTLVQTGKTPSFPVVLFGSSYWSGLIEWIRKEMLAEKMISDVDLELFFVTDDPTAAVAYIREVAEHGSRPR